MRTEAVLAKDSVICAPPPFRRGTSREDTGRSGESHERFPDQRRAGAARMVGTAETAVGHERERSAEPASTVARFATRHPRAHLEQRELLRRAALEPLHRYAAQARPCVATELRADACLAERILRDRERRPTHAPVVLQPA